MTGLDLLLIVVTLSSFPIGIVSIYWARGNVGDSRTTRGQVLFVATLICLGAIGLVAAYCRANGLAPLGLVAGMLVVGMLWESSAPELDQSATK